MKGKSLTHTRLWVAVRVMRYYNSVPLLGAVQTTSLLVVMIDAERGKPSKKSEVGGLGKHSRKSLSPNAAEGH